MDRLTEITNNINKILKRIDAACIRSGRSADEVKLLLATKTVSAENIKLAFDAGQLLIGENKVQEIIQKYDSLSDIEHETHFIGHLQSNKIKDVLRHNVSCIQSVDSLKLATGLQNKLELYDKDIDILIQVNTTNENTKFGVSPSELVKLVKEVALLDRIHIKGLMTIGLFSSDAAKVRSCYRLLKKLQLEVIDENIDKVEMGILSMGMSDHLEIAVEEGSTMVRVGTAIFGKRVYPDSYYWNEEK